MLGFQVWATTTGLIILFNAMLTSHQPRESSWLTVLPGGSRPQGKLCTHLQLHVPSGNCPQRPSTAWWQAGYILRAGIFWMDVDLVPNTIQHVAQVGSSLRVSKHTICEGLSEACCKTDERLSHFQCFGWFRQLLAGTLLPVCQPVNYFQLYLFVSAFWQIICYLSILQQWALPLSWWCLEVFLPFSASSYPERNEVLGQKTTRKKVWVGRAQSSTWT